MQSSRYVFVSNTIPEQICKNANLQRIKMLPYSGQAWAPLSRNFRIFLNLAGMFLRI